MKLLSALIGAFIALSLGACGTSRNLPIYERPLAHTDFQNVRTTAYTHTEADHRQYGNLTALGSVLHAAPQPTVPRAIPMAESESETADIYQPVAYVARARRHTLVYSYSDPVYGSAAADWSRWPAGTIFRIISTGQLYRVEDYGWALAGRNTIDLYMSTPRDMNGWGVRQELIQVVQWGDPQESLQKLARHTKYRHIKRMVLELEGHDRAAAHLH
jgi:3D (Asp-Asp-Asp) domain-containing protein